MFFTAVCVAQNEPKEKSTLSLSPTEAAQKFVDADNREDKTTADKIDAVVWRGIAGKKLLDGISDRLELLVREVDELAKKPEGKELNVVKFDFLIQRIANLKDIADSGGAVKAWEEIGGELKKIDNAIDKQIVLSAENIAETKRLQDLQKGLLEEVDKVKETYVGFVQNLARFSEAKLGEKPDETIKIRVDLNSQIEAYSSGSADIGEALIRPEDAMNVKRLLEQMLHGGGNVLDEGIKNREESLAAKRDDADLWSELCNLRFIRLRTQPNALEVEYQGQIITTLEDEIKEQTAIEKDLTFLRDYYTGLIAEHFGQTSKASNAFEIAVESAVTKEDRLKAKSKVLELQAAL